MTTRLIECYDVQLWDGGDRHNHHCYMMDEGSAHKIAGTHGQVYKKQIIVHDTEQDYRDFKNGEVKRKALAKLTDVEIAALGIKL